MRRLFLFVAAGAMAFGVSCNKSELQQPDVPNTPGGGSDVGPGDTEALVSFSTGAMNGATEASWTPLSKSDSKSMSIVYGLGEATEGKEGVETKLTASENATVENAVHNLWVLQYNASGDLVSEPTYTTDITQTAGSNTLTANVLVKNSGTDSHTVYFVANTNNTTLFNKVNAATVTEFEKMSQGVASEFKPSTTIGIPMVGKYTGTVGATVSGVTLNRLFAKVDFTYNIASPLTNSNFEVQSVRLCRVATAAYYCGTPTGKTVWPDAASGQHTDYTAETAWTNPTDHNTGKYVWYIPQNLQKAVKTNAAATASALGTYIEIVGYSGYGQGATVTYLVPVGSDGMGSSPNYNVVMNNVYTINVTLKGENSVSDHRVAVSPWSYSNCAMVAPGGTAELSMVNRKKKLEASTFDAANKPSLTWNLGTEYEVLVIWQDVQNLVESTTYHPASGRVSVKVKSGAPGNALVGLYPKGTSKTNAAIKLAPCIWSWHIWVSDYRPNGKKTYNLGVNAKSTDIEGGTGQVHTYGTKYRDAVNHVDPSSGYSNSNVRVMMDRNLGAIATAYDHPASTPEATGHANRYPTYGLFYQWGRPTPIPKAPFQLVIDDNAALQQPTYGPNGTELTNYPDLDTKTPQELQYVLKNPWKFVSAPSSPYDWNKTPNNDLWGDGKQKSVYDPCPDGWRVAPNGTWDDFGTAWEGAGAGAFTKLPAWTAKNQATAGGRYSAGDVKAFYPAPGSRDAMSARGFGGLRDVGNNGYSWSSTVTGSNAHFLDFGYYGVGPQDGNYRAYGLQLRCLQE